MSQHLPTTVLFVSAMVGLVVVTEVTGQLDPAQAEALGDTIAAGFTGLLLSLVGGILAGGLGSDLVSRYALVGP